MTATDRVLQRLRRLCLSLPETAEVGSWGHPNFRAGKRTFATFELVRGRPSIAFRLDPVDVDLLLRRKQFFVTPYGRGQWVSLWADTALDWRLVGHLLRRSYQVVALKRMTAALERTPKQGRRPNSDRTDTRSRNRTNHPQRSRTDTRQRDRTDTR